MRRASVDAGHSRRRVGLLQAASSGPNVSLLIVAIEEVSLTSTSAFGKVLEVAKPGWREREDGEKSTRRRAPTAEPRPSPGYIVYLPPQRSPTPHSILA